MTNSTAIVVRGLSKSFGSVRAVHDLSFTVNPGQVTGFLGPNGAGKTTTLRALLGLVRPTKGSATFGGTDYRDLKRPLETVGAALEASSFHPGRSARNHLRAYALAARLPLSRVDSVLGQVGIAGFADRRVGGYSLGMRQRLGLAFALLGDPDVLVLDEPANGLDPKGIQWMRTFLKDLARDGKTVLVSSHMLSEVQQSVDRVVIISRGALVFDGDLEGLESGPRVIVDAPQRALLGSALAASGATLQHHERGFAVTGLDASHVGAIAFQSGIALNHLSAEHTGIEKAFLELVGDPEAS